MRCIDNYSAYKTYPQFLQHPLFLARKAPAFPVRFIDGLDVVLPRLRRLKTAVNLDASRVVVLAKKARNAIGDAFVNTWNDDYKIPAKNICVKVSNFSLFHYVSYLYISILILHRYFL